MHFFTIFFQTLVLYALGVVLQDSSAWPLPYKYAIEFALPPSDFCLLSNLALTYDIALLGL